MYKVNHRKDLFTLPKTNKTSNPVYLLLINSITGFHPFIIFKRLFISQSDIRNPLRYLIRLNYFSTALNVNLIGW